MRHLTLWKGKDLILGLLLGLLVFTLSACEKNTNEPKGKNTEDPYGELIVDYMPIIFRIKVVNNSGANLIEPNHPESITKTNIRIEMDGKVYPLENLANKPEFRAYLAHFYGFYFYQDYLTKEWEIHFGQFDGGQEMDKTITLHWQDETTNSLRVVNKATWTKELGPHSMKRTFYLDGEKLPKDQWHYRFVR
ncbi:MAG: hypothetical protein Q4A61_04400 [Porphyromonadaceae bacterium]|nr:hypothetical protein [Porphyromonadaceae bacterium]